jgi:hypothetical protein
VDRALASRPVAALALLCLAAVTACQTRQPTRKTETPDRPVLFTAPVDPNTPERYVVSLGTCNGTECPIEVKLVRDGTTLDTARAEWNATAPQPTSATPDLVFGVGDPLQPDRSQVKAWSTGSEEQNVVTTARAVRLPGGKNAIVLDQVAGYEHPKRRHDIFAALNGKLTRVWSMAEQQGPYWTAVAIRPGSNGDELIFFQSFSPGGDEPDTIKAKQLRWDSSKASFTKIPAEGLKVVVAGTFRTLAAAREAMSKDTQCLAPFQVVKSADLGLRTGAPFAIAALTSRNPKEVSTSCAEVAQAQVVDYK